MTEWRPYRRPDWQRIADNLAGKAVFDGRNQYDAERLQRFGLTTYGIGTSKHILPAQLKRLPTETTRATVRVKISADACKYPLQASCVVTIRRPINFIK